MAGDGTGGPQASLDYTQAGEWSYSPLQLVRSASVPASVASRELDPWGLDPDWLGEQPFDQPMGTEFYRYQYDEIYLYPVRQGQQGNNEYYPVEFRVWVNVAEQQIPETLKRHFRVQDSGRLQALFDGHGYPEGYMAGFNFVERRENIEDDEIAADEATNLGIPQWEVLIHKEGSVEGHAGGFFDPFGIFEGVPEQERWNITYNTARDNYEFRPQGAALRRLKNRDSKQVYLNGKYIGQTVPSRGSVELSNTYSSSDLTWQNRETGDQMWSREKFVQDTPMPYQAIQAGGSVYKVNETGDSIFLVATKPDDFDPTPSEAVPSSAGEAARLDTADGTTFVVRFDEGAMLGKYSEGDVYTIEKGTSLIL